MSEPFDRYLSEANERRMNSGLTREYVRRMQKGDWEAGPGQSITVDPDATLFGHEVHYDTTPLLPPFTARNITVSNYELGLPPSDQEPDPFAVVELPWDWWGLMNVRTGTIVVKIHGPGAREDIVDRWNLKAMAWRIWRGRNS